MLPPRHFWSIRMKRVLLIAIPLCIAIPIMAQESPPQTPGVQDPARVAAGNYKLDPSHSQINWQVNHLGFNDYFGLFGDISGTLALDPANLAASKVDVSIPVAKVATSSAGLTSNLQSDSFLSAKKYPTARFVSSSVEADGNRAIIKGDLTLLGQTKPVTLEARFEGAGKNPMNPLNKKATVGFHATTTIKRSDWGMTKYIPLVGDEVKLRISVAFEKV